MNAKHIIGSINPTAIPALSAIAPIKGGQKAPPATAITRNEDPLLVRAPRS